MLEGFISLFHAVALDNFTTCFYLKCTAYISTVRADYKPGKT